MTRLLIAAAVAGLWLGWVSRAGAQTKDSAGDAKDAGGVGVGKQGDGKADEKGEGVRAGRKKSGIMYTKDEDDFYNAFANFTTPEKNRVMPWVVALTLAGGVLFVGLKQSFRNRFEG